jgi:hypothetical protein
MSNGQARQSAEIDEAFYSIPKPRMAAQPLDEDMARTETEIGD